MAQVTEIVTVLTVDARQAEAGARQFAQAIDETARKSQQLADAVQKGEQTLDNSAKVLRRNANEMESMLRAFDPLYGATQRLSGEQERLARAAETVDRQFRAGTINAEQRAQRMTLLTGKSAELTKITDDLSKGLIDHEQAHQRVGTVMVAGANSAGKLTNALGLTKAQMQALNPQLNDLISGLIMGQQPMQVITQQAGQFAQAFQAGGAELPKFTLATAAMAGGIALAAVAVGGIAVKIAQTSSEMRELTVALKAGGSQAQVTASQLQDMVTAMSKKGVSRSDATSILATVGGIQQPLNASQISAISSLAPDMAVKFGDAGAAFKKAVEYLTGGIPGIRAAYQETGALSLAQYEAARAAYEMGNRGKALQIVIDGLTGKFKGLHEEASGPAKAALEGLKSSIDAVFSAAANTKIVIGVEVGMGETFKALAELMSNPSAKNFAEYMARNLSFGQLGAPKFLSGGSSSSGAALPDQAAPPSPTGPPLASAPAGTPVPGSKPTSLNGMTPQEAGQISDLVNANNKLLEAMQKVGAERTVAMAQAQAEIAALNAGKSARAAENEGLEAARMARAQLSASIADQTAQYSIQVMGLLEVAEAYRENTAQGLIAAAQTQAMTDALQSGVDAFSRAQELIQQGAAQQAAAISQSADAMRLETEWTLKVADATKQGIPARMEAERQAQVAKQTSQLLAYAQAAEAQGDVELAAKLREVAGAYDEVSRAGNDAKKLDALRQYSQQQKEGIDAQKLEMSLVGKSVEQRAQVKATYQAELEIKRRGIDVTKQMTSAEQDVVTQIRQQAQESANLELSIQRQQAAWDEISNMLGRAFDRLGDALVDVFVSGSKKAVDWGNITRGIIASLMTDLIKMAAIRPLQNAMFGSNQPTLWDAMSGSAANQNGAGQGNLYNSAGQLVQFGQQAYNAYTGTNTLGTAASNFATSSMGQAIGLSMTGQAAATAAGGTSATAAGVMGVPGGVTAGTPVMSAAGSGLTTAASTIGSAMPYGALGGMAGAYLGTMTNSKAVAGISGAAIGAGTAYIGSIMATGAAMGPYGLIAAAIIAAIMAMVGTQKKSSGPWGLGYMQIEDGVAKPGYQHSDNGFPDENIKGSLTLASTMFNAIRDLGGGKIKDGYKNDEFAITMGAKDGIYRSMVGSEANSRDFDSLDKALIDGMKRLTEKLMNDGNLTLANESTLTALRNTKASTNEDFVKDIAAGSQWGQMAKVYSAGFNPFADQIKAWYDEAKKQSESMKEQYDDFLTRVVNLKLTDKDTAITNLRKSFMDQIGLGSSFFEQMTGMDAVTQQLKIEFESLKGTMKALGYSAKEQEEIYSQLLEKRQQEFDRQLRFQEMTGSEAVKKAINPNWTRSTADTIFAAGVRDDAPFFKGLVEMIDRVKNGGDAGSLSGVETFLHNMLGQSRITAEQFNSILTYAAEQFQSEATTVKDFQKSIFQERIQQLQAESQHIQQIADREKAWRSASLIGDMSPLSPKAKLDEAQRQYGELLAKAQGGDMTAADALGGVRDSVLKLAKDYYASSSGYVDIFNKMHADSSQIQTTAQRQLSEAQKQTALLQAQLNAQGASQTPWASVEKQVKDIMSHKDLYSAGVDNLGRSMADIQSTGYGDMTRGQFQAIARATGFVGGFGQGEHGAKINADAAYKTLWEQALGLALSVRGAHQFGGIVGAYADGGMVGNGLYNVDSVLARYAGGGSIALAGGEYVMPAEMTGRYRGELDAMRSGQWAPANDRWSAPNVAEFRRPAPPPSSGDDAETRRQNALLEEQNRLLRQILASNAQGHIGTRKAIEDGNGYAADMATEARLRRAAPRTGTNG